MRERKGETMATCLLKRIGYPLRDIMPGLVLERLRFGVRSGQPIAKRAVAGFPSIVS